MRFRRKYDQGFSLIEILIVMALLGVTSLVIASLTTFMGRQLGSLRALSLRDMVLSRLNHHVSSHAALTNTLVQSLAATVNPQLILCMQSSGSADCVVPNAGTTGAVAVNLPNGTQVYAYSLQFYAPNGTQPIAGNGLRYDLEGGICATQVASQTCPYATQLYFAPVCRTGTSCDVAESFRMIYDFTPDTVKIGYASTLHSLTQESWVSVQERGNVPISRTVTLTGVEHHIALLYAYNPLNVGSLPAFIFAPTSAAGNDPGAGCTTPSPPVIPAAPCGNAIPLAQFDPARTTGAPYVGRVNLSGRTGQLTAEFCVDPIAPTSARLKILSGSGDAWIAPGWGRVSATGFSFGNFGSNMTGASNTVFWATVDNAAGAAPGGVSITDDNYQENQSGCPGADYPFVLSSS